MLLIILSSSIDLLNVDAGLSVWTFVTFTLVFLLLWRFAWRPITDALDTRNQKIVDDLEKSRELKEKAETLFKEYEQRIQDAKQEAESIIERAHNLAIEQREETLEKTQQEVMVMKAKVAQELENERKKASEEFEGKVLDVAIGALSSLMRNKITADEHQEFILDEIKIFSHSS